MSGKYPNTIYRVSTKAIIRNKKNEVLVVRENGGHWSLVGGGIDHGETEHQALMRELYEEALITAPFTEKIIGIEPVFVEEYDSWLLWIVYEINIEDGFEYGLGPDADEIKFVDPKIFRASKLLGERLTYAFCVERSR
jgi:8-oxo-dGTP pyrophosphatase MutT (NUDIX family)